LANGNWQLVLANALVDASVCWIFKGGKTMQGRYNSILGAMLIGCVAVGITGCYKRAKHRPDTDSDTTVFADPTDSGSSSPTDSTDFIATDTFATDTYQTGTASGAEAETSTNDTTPTVDGTATEDSETQTETGTPPDTETDIGKRITPDVDLKPMPDCGISGCHEDATCIYEGDEPVCQCKSGFEGDGLNCSDIDECAADSTLCSGVSDGICTNTRGSYSCCPPGKNLNASQNQCVNAFTAGSVSVGDGYACALDMFGKAKCWGKDGDTGRTIPPRDRFLEVAASAENTCGITDEGILVCWGGTEGGIKANPLLYAKYRQLSAGWHNFCALTIEGAALCWEKNYHGSAFPGAFIRIDAGYEHNCGIYTDEGLMCAGSNEYGECDVPPGEFKWVSAGRFFTCAVQRSGVATCFGRNEEGQCDVPEGILFRKVVAGYYHACGLTEDNHHIVCWGKNYWGQCDAPEGTFVDVSVQAAQSCGVRENGEVVCWGSGLTPPYGTYLQVSAGFQTCGLTVKGSIECFETAPDNPVPPQGTFSEISVNMGHGCAVTADGSIQCWGNNDDGQCTAPPETFASVSAGYRFTCARKQDGTVQCWGLNDKGQCDPPGTPFEAISMGHSFGCGLDAAGKISCWGRCDDMNCASPDGLVFKSFKAGRNSVCGITADDEAICLGPENDEDPFRQMLQNRSFTDVFAGDAYICAITTEGIAECLGNRELFYEPPSPEGTFIQLTGQSVSPCGLRTDGTIACWAWVTL
jgi:alpha-tubulin suppressor-like RCC1 family protein